MVVQPEIEKTIPTFPGMVFSISAPAVRFGPQRAGAKRHGDPKR